MPNAIVYQAENFPLKEHAHNCHIKSVTCLGACHVCVVCHISCLQNDEARHHMHQVSAIAVIAAMPASMLDCKHV